MNRFFREKLMPHAVPAALLAVAVFSVYARILGHDFQLFWDDEKYVTINETIRGFSLDHLKQAFTTNYMGNYAPIHIISYMLDNAVWGLKSSGFFLTNLALHSANGMLFYALLIRIGWHKRWAVVSALVFLLHPVQVESVAWISERKNLLAMFFSLSSFAAYLSYRQKGWGEGKKAYLFSIVLFVLALLSKSVAVVLPPILVLYDLCYLGKGDRSRWQADKLPFVCAAAIMAWVTIQCQLPGDMPGVGGGRIPWHGGSPFATLLTMLTVLPRYLLLIFRPTGLSAIYDPPIRTSIDGAVLGSGLLVLLLTAGGVALFRWDRRLFFWYGLFFIGLLPVSQIVPIVTLMNDRYLYFPMLGAAACFGGLASREDSFPGARRAVTRVAAGFVLAAILCLSFVQAEAWRNDLTLWCDAAKRAPNHYVALYGYAQALQNSGDLDGALPLYLRALQLNPRHLDTLTHLGALYRSKGMPFSGRPYLLDVTRYYPALAKGFIDLGLNYYLTGELNEAENAFRSALSLQPRSRDAALYLGLISLRTTKLAAARDYFLNAVSLGGTTPEIEYNLACVESLSGHSGPALQHLETAFRMGFRDRDSIDKDRDIDAIRQLPDFRVLVYSFLDAKAVPPRR